MDMLGQNVRYWGPVAAHHGETALVVNQGKGVLMDGRLPWAICLLFDNNDSWWVDADEVEAVVA